VGDSDAGYDLSPVEQYVFKQQNSVFARIRNSMVRKELVILHKDGNKLPSNTRKWLKDRKVRMHHHIRTQSQHNKDYGRLARMLTGQAIGLVLGGGGAKGCAHIGVLAALEEAGISVDYIAGTSQGACVGGLYAMCGNSAEVRRRSQHQVAIFGNPLKMLSDLTLPIISYFSGVEMNNMLRTIFKRTDQRLVRQQEMQIEDLWIKFCCTTTSMCNHKLIIQETGPLWKYVRASMSLLGLFPPVYDHGDVLVDGGYVNNLPIDVVFALGAETVIAVDVENKDNSAFEELTDYGEALSGWWLLWRMIGYHLGLSEKVKIPPISEAHASLFYIASDMRLKDMIEEGERSGKVLYLRPKGIQGYGMTDYAKIDEIVKRGYDTAKEKIPEFRHFRQQLMAQNENKILNKNVKRSKSHEDVMRVEVESSAHHEEFSAQQPHSKESKTSPSRRIMSGIIFHLNSIMYRYMYTLTWLNLSILFSPTFMQI
jgi:lysophospholipid hydrolase